MKRKRRISIPRSELFFQFILTYIIMAAILTVTLLVMCGSEENRPTLVQIFERAIDAFSPTTITFIGTYLVSRYFNKKSDAHMLRTTALIISLVLNSLCYVAFSSVILGENIFISYLIAAISFSLIIFDSVLILSSERNQSVSESNATENCCNMSDGSVCALARHNK